MFNSVNDLWEFFGPKVVDEGGFQLVVEKGEDHAIFFGYVPLEDSTGRSYAAVIFSSKKLLENARRAFEYYGSGLVVGSGYLVPPFKAWNITALWKYDAEGQIRMASSPPSSQHGERYNHKLGSDVLCGRRCSRQHLIEIVIPQLLLIDGHRFGNLSFIPPKIYPSPCAAASARLFDLYPSGS